MSDHITSHIYVSTNVLTGSANKFLPSTIAKHFVSTHSNKRAENTFWVKLIFEIPNVFKLISEVYKFVNICKLESDLFIFV